MVPHHPPYVWELPGWQGWAAALRDADRLIAEHAIRLRRERAARRRGRQLDRAAEAAPVAEPGPIEAAPVPAIAGRQLTIAMLEMLQTEPPLARALRVILDNANKGDT